MCTSAKKCLLSPPVSSFGCASATQITIFQTFFYTIMQHLSRSFWSRATNKNIEARSALLANFDSVAGCDNRKKSNEKLKIYSMGP
jgi:hypothetical protein